VSSSSPHGTLNVDKMVEQALLAPGDIVLVIVNCQNHTITAPVPFPAHLLSMWKPIRSPNTPCMERANPEQSRKFLLIWKAREKLDRAGERQRL